jgi:hypothetical protein
MTWANRSQAHPIARLRFKRTGDGVDGRGAVHLAGYILSSAIVLGCGVICALKGKFWFVAFGVLLPIFWIVGAVRPAKAYSPWFGHFSDDFQISERPASD